MSVAPEAAYMQPGEERAEVEKRKNIFFFKVVGCFGCQFSCFFLSFFK